MLGPCSRARHGLRALRAVPARALPLPNAGSRPLARHGRGGVREGLGCRRECLTRVISLGERHLRELVSEYVVHYHLERPHQGLGNRLVAAEKLRVANDHGRSGAVGAVRHRERLGGLLSNYHRDAA